MSRSLWIATVIGVPALLFGMKTCYDNGVRARDRVSQRIHAADSTAKVHAKRTDSLETALVVAKAALRDAEADYEALTARYRLKPRTVYDTSWQSSPPDTVPVPMPIVRTIIVQADSVIDRCRQALGICEAGNFSRDTSLLQWRVKWDARPRGPSLFTQARNAALFFGIGYLAHR